MSIRTIQSAVLLGAGLFLLPTCADQEAETVDLAIRGATIVDLTGGPSRTDTTILIDQGKIIAIDSGADGEVVQPLARETIDARGKYIIPGLADMHVHFGSGGLGPRQENATDAAIAQFVHYGVTTVLNVGATGGNRQEVQEIRARQARGELPGLNIYATGDMLTIPGSHPIATIMTVPEGVDPESYDWSLRGVAVVANAAEARTVVAMNFEAGMDAIKIIVESGPTEFGLHPQMPPEMIAAVVDEASKRGGFVVAHISSLDELEDCIDAGVRAVVHAVSEPPWPESRHWEAMVAKEIYYVPTLALFGSLYSTLWSDPATLTDPFFTDGVGQPERQSVAGMGGLLESDDPIAEWNLILQSVKSAHDAGVQIALGTDTNNPRVFPGYSVHRELETYVELGLTPAEALRAATQVPAQLVRRTADFGRVETGKRADLLILSANPLDDIRNTRSIETIVLGGVRF